MTDIKLEIIEIDAVTRQNVRMESLGYWIRRINMPSWPDSESTRSGEGKLILLSASCAVKEMKTG